MFIYNNYMYIYIYNITDYYIYYYILYLIYHP